MIKYIKKQALVLFFTIIKRVTGMVNHASRLCLYSQYSQNDYTFQKKNYLIFFLYQSIDKRYKSCVILITIGF